LIPSPTSGVQFNFLSSNSTPIREPNSLQEPADPSVRETDTASGSRSDYHHAVPEQPEQPAASTASTTSAQPAPASVLTALKSPKLLTVEILGGLVTAFALIPESLSFAIVAGLDPRMGLYAAFTMACVTAVLGGRPGMVSGAAGSIALVIFPVARDHGVEYLLATVILGGVLQMVMGALGVAKLMRFIPRSVMVGFVDALAILIFTAQLQHLFNVPWQVYPLVIGGLVIMALFPKLTTKVPAHPWRPSCWSRSRP
jgi:SulP family sulfate permease